jgi:hypothetical protein
MIATQRSDGQFVDVKTDTHTVSFKRPTLAQFGELQDAIAANKFSSGFLKFGLACAESETAAMQLFEEWPGATATVATALFEMVTPKLRATKATR